VYPLKNYVQPLWRCYKLSGFTYIDKAPIRRSIRHLLASHSFQLIWMGAGLVKNVNKTKTGGASESKCGWCDYDRNALYTITTSDVERAVRLNFVDRLARPYFRRESWHSGCSEGDSGIR
jgi:hypothetical protein